MEALRSILYRKPERYLSFSQQIHQAIGIRSENIKGIKSFISNQVVSNEGKIEDLWIKDVIEKCNKMLGDSFSTLAVIGPVNSGKSTLVSSLLDWEIHLPSSDEVMTSRVTRIVYSTTPIIRKIRVGLFNEQIEFEKSFSADLLIDLINLPIEERDDQYELAAIIEIGWPLDILKNGFKIIDFPGFDENETVCKIQLEMLELMAPSIICYVNHFKHGFKINDAKFLSKVYFSLSIDHRYETQFMLIVNQYNLIEKNCFDADYEESELLSEKQLRQSLYNTFQDAQLGIANISSFSDKNPFLSQYKSKIDFYMTIPIVCITSSEIFCKKLLFFDPTDLQSQEETFKMQDLQYLLCEMTIASSRSILTNLADYCLQSQIDDENKRINLWLTLKSLSLDADLIDLILMIQQCSSDVHLLVDFTRGYKIFGLTYKEDEIQVTEITDNNDIDFQLTKKLIVNERDTKLCRFHQGRSSCVYFHETTKQIYLIDKHKPHKRLIDNFPILEEKLGQFYHTNILKDILIQLLFEMENFVNFRPDNVYMDDNGSIYVNTNVPNNIPYIFDMGFFGPTQPFRNPDKISFRKDESTINFTQFLCSLGWFIWIIIIDIAELTSAEIRDDNICLSLVGYHNLVGYSTKFCEYLLESMELCWNLNRPSLHDCWKSIYKRLSKFTDLSVELRSSEQLPVIMLKEFRVWLLLLDWSDSNEWLSLIKDNKGEIQTKSIRFIQGRSTIYTHFVITDTNEGCDSDDDEIQILCVVKKIDDYHSLSYINDEFNFIVIDFRIKFHLYDGGIYMTEFYRLTTDDLKLMNELKLNLKIVPLKSLNTDMLPEIYCKLTCTM